MKIKKLILLTISILILVSCSKESSMRITTNTFANTELIPTGFKKQASFSISTKQKGNELFSKEVSSKIASILEENGFIISNSNYADYNLFFSFGMEKSTHVRDVPVYIPNYESCCYNSSYYPYRYNYIKSYIPEEYTLFNKILLIEVYKDKKPIWQGTAQSYEEDNDLRDTIDYLLITIFKYFGKNTQKNIITKVEDNNKNIEKLRQKYFKSINNNTNK